MEDVVDVAGARLEQQAADPQLRDGRPTGPGALARPESRGIVMPWTWFENPVDPGAWTLD